MDFSETALNRVREDRLLIDRVDQWLYEEIAPYLGRRILEVGCGLGNFMPHFLERDLYVGTDISAESIATLAARYGGHANVAFLVADAASDEFTDLRRFDVDTVFSLNVFEHIEDDVKAMAAVWQVLPRGGTFILVVPAHRWLYGATDRAIGHNRRYTKSALALSLGHLGFECVRQKYINALGALGWFVSGRVFRHQTPPSGQLRLFNAIVPLIKHLERIVEPPFGISLMTVARKPLGLDT